LKFLITLNVILLVLVAILIPGYAAAECPAGYFVADHQPNASWYNIDVDGTIQYRVAHTVDTATNKDCLVDVNTLAEGPHTLKAQVCFQCTGTNVDPDCEWCGEWSDITAVKPGAASGLSFQW
jgi:hypothetical protein